MAASSPSSITASRSGDASQPTAAPRSWTRLFFSRANRAEVFYDLLGDHVLGATGDLANMGLWRGGVETLEAAVAAMFALVREGARLAAGQRVIDAGCGFGTLAIECVQRHDVRLVTGLNLSDVQLDLARRRTAAAGLADRVELRRASATAMPFADASVDCVVSTEAAFHFETRADFFREVARVLRPGGRLSMTDLVAPRRPSWVGRSLQSWARRGVRMPSANVGDLRTVRAQVEQTGLVVERCESIAPEVIRPFRRWFLRQPLREMLRYDVGMMLATAPYFLVPWDYVCLVAHRAPP
jgi:cyclopropane fatty-acyl-phospholipid synthase-like methyltransferase